MIRKRPGNLFGLLLLAAVLVSASPPYADLLLQAQCGVVDSLQYPVDTSLFTLVQNFGVASVRHQGRYHTGEDWYGGRGSSRGQPVRAVARGRVTYAAPNGWGRDGGVVIIEHTMPDNRILYSVYGHIVETPEYAFPTRYGCVQQGDIVGVIGDARPAPHLHFEFRINNGDIPGPGYEWENPLALGYRQPARIITNWSAWLGAAHRWHVALSTPNGMQAPPLQLNDNSLIYLETPTLLKRATADGRVLWRVNLERTAVGVTGYQGSTYLHYADGGVTQIDENGAALDRWDSTVPVDSAPLAAVFPDGDALLFHTPDNALVAFNPTRRAVLWRLDNVPPFVLAQVTPQMIALVSRSADGWYQLFTVSLEGRLLDQAQLRALPAFAAAPDGTLLVYSAGGLWRVDSSGTWSYALDNAPALGAAAALAADSGGLVVFDGSQLSGFDTAGVLRWQTPFSASGQASLTRADGRLLLLTAQGHIAVFDAASGAVCGSLRLYGDGFTRLPWGSAGSDGLLRVALGDSISGLSWSALTAGCG